MGKKLNNNKHDFVSPAIKELHNDPEYFAKGQELHQQYKDFKGDYIRRNISRQLFEKISNFIKDAYHKRFNYHPERTQGQILQAWGRIRRELDKMKMEGTGPTKPVEDVIVPIKKAKTLETIVSLYDIDKNENNFAPPFTRPAKHTALLKKVIEEKEEEIRMQNLYKDYKSKDVKELKRMLKEG